MHRDSPNENNTFSFPNSSLATFSYVATTAVFVNEASGFQGSLCAHSPPLIWLTKLELRFSGFVDNISKNTHSIGNIHTQVILLLD